MRVKILFIFFLLNFTLVAYSSNTFYFAQLKYNGGNWDPNPDSWSEIYDFIISTTNVHCAKERKEITLNNNEIFNYPFLVISGDSEFNKFSDKEIEILKRYFDGGGICFIDDASGIKDFGFDRAIKREFSRIFPNSNFERIKDNHAIFYAFYLIPQVVGTKVSVPYLEGIEYNNQMAVIYSHNDLFGIWAKDKLGNFLKDCSPYGEKQRFEGMKLTVNIFMYALTGTYKLDAIHSQYIQRKIEEMRMLEK
jgi:hypothetical protein